MKKIEFKNVGFGIASYISLQVLTHDLEATNISVNVRFFDQDQAEIFNLPVQLTFEESSFEKTVQEFHNEILQDVCTLLELTLI